MKVLVSVVVCRWIGSEFHAAGPEKLKARSPNFVRILGFQYERPLAERRPVLVAVFAVIDTRSRML